MIRAPCADATVTGSTVFGSTGRKCVTWTPSWPTTYEPTFGTVVAWGGVQSVVSCSAVSPVVGSTTSD